MKCQECGSENGIHLSSCQTGTEEYEDRIEYALNDIAEQIDEVTALGYMHNFNSPLKTTSK